MGNIFEDNEDENKTVPPEEVDKLAEEVSRRTNLSNDICRELLLGGWKFSQEIGKPDRWERMY